MVREGSGEPLVLLHGVLCSERIWRDVVPLLTAYHDVIVPTALGHRGGAPVAQRPGTMTHVIDDVERTLDELDLDTVHFAGNSMGGWAALELARRGRARTVCALSPAGCWELDSKEHRRTEKILSETVRDTRRGQRMLSTMAHSKRFRRWATRYSLTQGGRLTHEDFLALTDDLLGCALGEDLRNIEGHLERLDPPPCPITLAWSAQDELFPVAVNGAYARRAIPGARFVVIPGAGHLPMIDAPRLTAETILETTAASVEERPLAAALA